MSGSHRSGLPCRGASDEWWALANDPWINCSQICASGPQAVNKEVQGPVAPYSCRRSTTMQSSDICRDEVSQWILEVQNCVAKIKLDIRRTKVARKGQKNTLEVCKVNAARFQI